MSKPIICKEPFVRQAAQEFAEKYPEATRRLNHRIEKAADLAATGMIIDLGVIDLTPTFAVRSQTSQIFYRVQGRGETWQICSCPDNQKGYHCKHGLAALFALRALELEQQFRSQWEAAFAEDKNGKEQTA